MKTHTIQAYLSTVLPAELPDSIEWMPGGTHEISASKNGKPSLVTVTVSEGDVARLNAQLADLLSSAEAGKRSRPFIDFAHEGKEAAALPKNFFWQDGIRLAVEWTQAGRDAVLGRVFAYFSPSFLLSDEGAVSGIPEYGAIGGLVNTPAFQTIERLAAAHTFQESQDQTMKNIIAKLGLAENSTEQQIEAKIGELVTAQASLALVTAERDSLVTKAKEVKAAAISAEIEGFVTAKRVTPETKAFWTASFERDEEGTRKALSAIIVPTVPASGVPPVAAELTGEPEKMKGAALLAHYKSLTGADRDKFFKEKKNEIWAAYSAV